jgi:hypothetical protein
MLLLLLRPSAKITLTFHTDNGGASGTTHILVFSIPPGDGLASPVYTVTFNIGRSRSLSQRANRHAAVRSRTSGFILLKTFQTVDVMLIETLPEKGTIKGATSLTKGNGPSKEVVLG